MSSIEKLDVAITGGRVVDPETGLDEVTNVGLRAGLIAYVGADRVEAATTIDVRGRVVAPGFVDIHSHALDPAGMHFQALDGVTTALELEAGGLPVGSTLDWMRAQGLPLNFGLSASWLLARAMVMDGVKVEPPQRISGFRVPMDAQSHIVAATDRRIANATEIRAVSSLLLEQLDMGALGIGVLLGYVPWAGREEVDALLALASRRNVPLFVHSRSLSPRSNGGAIDAVRELVDGADRSGAHVHLCHLNSTSGRMIREAIAIIDEARSRGVRITTEAYPYGCGATKIGAAFLAPELLAEGGLTSASITYLATGERVADARRLAEIRKADPDGACIVEVLDEASSEGRQLLMDALSFPGAAVASDSAPVVYTGSETDRAGAQQLLAGKSWPLPRGFRSHPRSAGTFARALRWLSLEGAHMSLVEAIDRCTLTPANILGDAFPAMRRKGRIQVGADGDIVILDLSHIRDRATYTDLRPSEGVEHLFVGGDHVVRAGNVIVGTESGAAITRETDV